MFCKVWSIPLNLFLPDLQERSLFPNIKYYSQNLSLELMVGQWQPPVHRCSTDFVLIDINGRVQETAR
ncbi:hypothetical protein [Bradyrhizobium yuanmingense]|uniref:hypothetical protein n=1 Tax=Bradyrhizobium yuanmingense TaxID=108015 RepID=UPI0023B9B93B|nr:hypothetical protein [Bradyrhizobium yuanmingense]MDF0492961.1 hypothetical protein [Bradyrhizobium yuanmingense]